MRDLIRSFLRRDEGAIAIVVALVLPIMIGVVSLVAEYGNGLVAKAENQRTADLAAYAGALAYSSTGSTAAMNAAANGVAALNNIDSTGLTVSLTDSPRTPGQSAVSVTVATSNVLLLAPVLGSGASLTVRAQAYAEIGAAAPGCIVALSTSGTGVTLSGGTRISGANCTVASNATVSVPCGTSVTVKLVAYYSDAAPSQPCGGILSASGGPGTIKKVLTSDPLANQASVTAAVARLSTVTALASPSAPAVASGTDIDFGWTQSATMSQAAAAGCGASFDGSTSTWTLTCPSGGSYNFGTVSVGGGIKVNFNIGGSASTTYNFSGAITNGGASLAFGPGTFKIAQGITTGGGSVTSFGAGSFTIGTSAAGCNGGGRYSICNTGTSLTFGGPSSFRLASGLYNSGGAILTLGAGTTNSFTLGASSDGNSVYLGGGSKTVFADALSGSASFQLAGNFNMAGGGSCVTVSAAAQHDIKGYFASAGGMILGAGNYTVNGYIALGASGGGNVTCNGTSVGVSAQGVTFVTAATSTPSWGSCAGQGFCVAAGYSNVTITAPSSGPTANLAVVGPLSSSNTAGASFAEGAGTSISGAFYFPNGALTFSGGASMGDGPGQCLQLIGSSVSLSGGATATSSCFGSNVSGQVMLVQ